MYLSDYSQLSDYNVADLLEQNTNLLLTEREGSAGE